MTTTKTQTITDFLLARIAEDEAVARAAGHQKAAGPFHGEWEPDSWFLAHGGTIEVEDRKHIARHDPARVLAECKAKRGIVEFHKRDDVMDSCSTCARQASAGDYFPGEDDGDSLKRVDFPCDTLKAITAIWSDHYDYNPEWA